MCEQGDQKCKGAINNDSSAIKKLMQNLKKIIIQKNKCRFSNNSVKIYSTSEFDQNMQRYRGGKD